VVKALGKKTLSPKHGASTFHAQQGWTIEKTREGEIEKTSSPKDMRGGK